MTTNTARTPGPWELERGHQSDRIYAIKGITRWNFLLRGASAESQANAAFIVRAANCHDELVAALQTLVDALPEDGEWGHFLDIKQAAIAALAKAKP